MKGPVISFQGNPWLNTDFQQIARENYNKPTPEPLFTTEDVVRALPLFAGNGFGVTNGLIGAPRQGIVRRGVYQALRHLKFD